MSDGAAELGFEASCADAVGELLKVCAATKPAGRLLELGTGVGVGTAYLLAGMTPDARLTTVEVDVELSAVARQRISDPRVEWVVADGGPWLEAQARTGTVYDVVFADTWPGKFTHLEQALGLVAPGGLYVVDDLTPLSSWPSAHLAGVLDLRSRLEGMAGWVRCSLDVGSGVLLCARSGGEDPLVAFVTPR